MYELPESIVDVSGSKDVLYMDGLEHDSRHDGNAERVPSVQLTSSLPEMVNPPEHVTVYKLPESIVDVSGLNDALSMDGWEHD